MREPGKSRKTLKPYARMANGSTDEREMDTDSERRKASLVREYLQRHSVEEWFGGEILRCLPTPHLLHPHLKKAILLRRLSADLSLGLLSEDTLQALEVIEEVDRSVGAAGPSRAMGYAYSTVAAELTVAPLRRGRRGGVADFLEMVDRVWRCRIEDLERRDARWMAGEGPGRWRTAIEQAVDSAAARDWLLRRDTRQEATEAVREYLREAIEAMGPPLLELVARAARGEQDGACAGEDDGQSGGEGCAGGSTGAPAEEMARPVSATSTDGGRRVPETETDRNNELTGQTEEFFTADRASEEQITLLSSPEVNRVKEVPKSSCEELQRMVVDTLPDAPETSTHLQISMLETSAINPTDACDNKHQRGASEPGPSLEKDVQGTENNADGAGHGGIPSPGLPHADLMHTAACTYKGNEGSKECPSGEPASSSRRTPLPTREGRPLSFKSQEAPKFLGGRRRKRWTPEEEDALREGIKKHGKGNWKFILQAYPATFKDRTEVDLKDKWRNMNRISGGT